MSVIQCIQPTTYDKIKHYMVGASKFHVHLNWGAFLGLRCVVLTPENPAALYRGALPGLILQDVVLPGPGEDVRSSPPSMVEQNSPCRLSSQPVGATPGEVEGR